MTGTAPPPAPEPASLADGAGIPVRAAREALTVRRVFGEPYRVDDVTVIPVARVRGGSGMGFGSGPVTDHGAATGPASAADVSTEGTATGSARHGEQGAGGGFAISARAAGVYVITGGRVRWEPALDLGRVILGGQLVGALAVVVWGWARRRP